MEGPVIVHTRILVYPTAVKKRQSRRAFVSPFLYKSDDEKNHPH